MPPTAVTLLRAWEYGAAAAPGDRATSLLHSLGAVEGVDELTVGQCDARLIELRRALFGELLEAVATCPACGTEVDVTVPLRDLQPPLRDDPVPVSELPVPEVTVRADGYTLVCRIPRNGDLRALARRPGEVRLLDLLERCVLEASSPTGTPVAPRDLPEATVTAVAEALAESDPGAQTMLRMRCGCGGEWTDELDIRAVVWSDLTEWVGQALTEVHLLARAYGWSESDILAMSGWRRRWYLEAAGWLPRTFRAFDRQNTGRASSRAPGHGSSPGARSQSTARRSAATGSPSACRRRRTPSPSAWRSNSARTRLVRCRRVRWCRVRLRVRRRVWRCMAGRCPRARQVTADLCPAG